MRENEIKVKEGTGPLRHPGLVAELRLWRANQRVKAGTLWTSSGHGKAQACVGGWYLFSCSPDNLGGPYQIGVTPCCKVLFQSYLLPALASCCLT